MASGYPAARREQIGHPPDRGVSSGAVDDLQRHVEQAVELLREGKLGFAAAEFEQAVRLAPASLGLRQRLADVYLRMGQRTAAVRELAQVVGRYAADGQLLRAIAFARFILEIDPQHQRTLRTLAELYALQHESLPLVQKLPREMSGALSGPSEPQVDLEQLKLFRDALGSVPPQPAAPRDPTDEDTAELPPVTERELPKLPRSPLFSTLAPATFQALVRRLELRWMKAGETLVTEGEHGDSMFVVVQGVVNVVHGERLIAVMAEGSFFGEMALCTDAPRLATVVAAKDGLLLEIDREALDAIAREHPSVREAVEAFYRDRLLANLLRASPVFRPLGESERAKVGERFARHSLPPQTVVLEQGQAGAGFCVLLRGRCDVFHTDRDGVNLPLPQLREGDVFGEISLLLDGPCTASVRTATFCEVLELPRADFHALVLPNPEVRELVQRLVRERIDRTLDLLVRENRVLPSYTV